MFKKSFPYQRTVTHSEDALSELLEKRYKHKVEQKGLTFDPFQLIALKDLQHLLDQLIQVNQYRKKSFRQKLFHKQHPLGQSIYLYGDVGRGKSMLMALFYEACPIKPKTRVHFSLFMLEVHSFMHQWRQANQSDAMTALANEIRSHSLVLCIDEFHVTDIADAMILERLFIKLFNLGILIVITSNRHPDDLYQGGIQREQFLKFTRLLKKETKLIELLAKHDYRLKYLKALEISYHFPLGQQADDFITQRYSELTQNATIETQLLSVLGRHIKLTAIYKDIALASFDELCTQALGSIDYTEIARHFKLLILTNIPQLSSDNRNEAKRFMLLIDSLYEHKVKLICTAAVCPEDLYTEGDGIFEFRRTTSRLIEMQSKSYLQSN